MYCLCCIHQTVYCAGCSTPVPACGIPRRIHPTNPIPLTILPYHSLCSIPSQAPHPVEWGVFEKLALSPNSSSYHLPMGCDRPCPARTWRQSSPPILSFTQCPAMAKRVGISHASNTKSLSVFKDLCDFEDGWGLQSI